MLRKLTIDSCTGLKHVEELNTLQHLWLVLEDVRVGNEHTTTNVYSPVDIYRFLIDTSIKISLACLPHSINVLNIVDFRP